MGGRDRQISEFEASLVYRVSSRTARATQSVSKKKTKNKNNNNNKTSSEEAEPEGLDSALYLPSGTVRAWLLPPAGLRSCSSTQPKFYVPEPDKSELQGSQDYTEKPCLEERKERKRKRKDTKMPP